MALSNVHLHLPKSEKKEVDREVGRDEKLVFHGKQFIWQPSLPLWGADLDYVAKLVGEVVEYIVVYALASIDAPNMVFL